MRTSFIAIAAMLSTAPVIAAAPIAAAQTAAARDPLIERLQVRADTAEQTVQRLTGRVEQLGFQNNQLRQALEGQNEQVETLKNRLSKLEARIAELESLASSAAERAAGVRIDPAEQDVTLVGPTDPATMAARAAARADAELDESLQSKLDEEDVSLMLEEEPEALFRQAKNLLLRGDYPAAETAFGEFLKQHSETEQASEAQYWLAESLLIQEAFPEATEAYVKLVGTWPDAEKAPDAFVKLARSLRKMGQTDQACQALSQVKSLYPDVGPVIRSSIAREQDRAQCGDA